MTPQCEEAFSNIKKLLTTPPLLAHYNPKQDLIIDVDASDQGIGAALLQKNPETNQIRPIAYMSKKFVAAQKRWSSCEKEMYGMSYAVNYFRDFVYGRPVTVYTDCGALIFYKQFQSANSRLNRLAMSLIDYDLDVKHKKGLNNQLADSLSRLPTTEVVDQNLIQPNYEISAITEKDLPKLQAEDPYLNKIINAINNPDGAEIKIRRASRKYNLKNGILYYNTYDGHQAYELLVIPTSLRPGILKAYHDGHGEGGHFAFQKTYSKIKQKYYWPTIATDVQQYTKTCDGCQKRRIMTAKPYGTLNPHVHHLTPFHKLFMDVYGPIGPSNSYKYCLVITESTTHYAFAIPVRNLEAQTIAKELLKLFTQFGYPKILVHDQATYLMSDVMKHLSTALGIDQHPIPSYAPNVVGIAEKFNQTLGKCLSHYCENEPQQWSRLVKYITFIYNITPHVSFQGKYSPFFLLFGRNANTPHDYLILLDQNADKNILSTIATIDKIRKEVPKLIKKSQDRQKMYYDRKHRPLTLNPGDDVLIYYPRSHNKPYAKICQPIYKGPYTVVKQISPQVVEVEILKHGKLIKEAIHVQRIKLYNRRM